MVEINKEKYCIVNGKTYKYSDIEAMDIIELDQLQHEIAYAITNITMKRHKYRVAHTEDTPETEKKEKNYTIALTRLSQAQSWVASFRKQKNREEHEDKEKWFFYFYKEVKSKVPAFMFNKFVKNTAYNVGYDIVVND